MVFRLPDSNVQRTRFFSSRNHGMDLCDLSLRGPARVPRLTVVNRTTFLGFHVFRGDCHGLAQRRSSVFAGLHIPPGFTVIFTSAGKYALFLSIYFRLLGLKQLFTLEARMSMCGLGCVSGKESRAKVVNTMDIQH